MAELASYVGIVPRTIQADTAALIRGVRVTKSNTGVCAVTSAATRGDFVTLHAIEASAFGAAASLAGAGKVAAYASENTTAGALAYGAASGQFSVTSTNAALLGRWTTATTVNTLGEVELFEVA